MDQISSHSIRKLRARPDSASVHVLYAGNLADDDFMWIVECTIEEFHKMLNYPTEWVSGLSTLPDWQYVGTQKPAPPPVLLKHFTMRIRQRGDDAASDLITIQGISRTGIVTVRASKASAVVGVRNLTTFRDGAQTASVSEDASFMDPPAAVLAGFWDGIAYDPTNAPTYKKQYAVNVDTTDSRYYGHFEICQPGTSDPQERIAQTAAFILALGSDPQGFTSMLNGLDQTTLYINEGGVVRGTPIAMAPPPNTPDGPQILYTSLDDDTEASCMILDGPYDPSHGPGGTGGTGTVDNPIVKKYGVDVPPEPDPPKVPL